MALMTTLDMFLIPFANVVSAVSKDKSVVLHQKIVNNLGKRLLVLTVGMDIAFLLNILVHVAQVRVFKCHVFCCDV